MRIAVTGHLLKGRNTGVEHYITNIMRNVPAQDAENEYLYYVNRAVPDDIAGGGRVAIKRNDITDLGRPVRFMWEQVRLPALLARDNVDLLHAPGYTMPVMTRIPTVVTIHDTIAMRYPAYCSWSTYLHYRVMLPWTAARARRIITTTEYTKRDIIDTLGVSPGKIDVVPLAVHHAFRPIEDRSIVRGVVDGYGLPADIILFVGNLEPKKNVEMLIEAFGALVNERAIPHGLVLAGRRAWLYKRLLRKVRSLGLGDRVYFPGEVPIGDLVSLYNAADVFVFPSLYEGFGIPPLEAMACGVPVVTADSSALPEVVGDAAVTVDPKRPRELIDALRRVLTDDSLRAGMRKRGLERAKRYTWERTARGTVAVYRRAAAGGDD
jgi:glycosyltransferase involved in cell wall biosynthesis